MQTRTKVVLTVAVSASIATAGCSVKSQEPFKDAPRGQTNTAPADVVTMPDGFSNLASKCDGPTRIYVIFHGDGTYGSGFGVPNDPRCTGKAG